MLEVAFKEFETCHTNVPADQAIALQYYIPVEKICIYSTQV